jgi:hypothetical protein
MAVAWEILNSIEGKQLVSCQEIDGGRAKWNSMYEP